MQDGVIGLYKNDIGVIHCTIRKGDDRLPLEDILPPVMCGAGFADAPVSAFINQSYLYLASVEQWEQWWQDVPVGTKVTKPPPPLDIAALKLEKPGGQIDGQRLAQLFSLIWPYWEKEPPLGLIAHLVRLDTPIPQIAQMLELHDRYGNRIEHLDKCFAAMFLPPDLTAQGYVVSDDQLEYALRWFRRPDGTGDLKQDELYWTLNFRELGIVDTDGRLNRPLAKRARAFVWAEPGREPDYFALRDHLVSFAPPAKPSNDNQKTLPKAYLQKLKKRQRKAGRVRRKR